MLTLCDSCAPLVTNIEDPIGCMRAAGHDGRCRHVDAFYVVEWERDGMALRVISSDPLDLHWQDDKPDMWSPSIEAAFPTRSGSYDEYAQAMEMISHRHSKGSLVALVNWLLLRAKRHEYFQVSGIGHCAICGSDWESDGNHIMKRP